MKWGRNVMIGRAMAEEMDGLAWADLAKNFHVPLKVISAGKGVLVKGAKRYFRNAKGKKELTIVKSATHYFDDTDEMREKVFEMTKEWFAQLKFLTISSKRAILSL